MTDDAATTPETPPETTTDRILGAAEARVRAGGYHAVSFRQIAADVGIKSSSVHHHFPTKEALGAAVARAYTERFMAALGDPEEPSRQPGQLLALYIDLFRRALLDDRQVCLCGVLAAERAELPPAVDAATREFFSRNIDWLEAVLKRLRPKDRPRRHQENALKVVATLEGALLLAHALGSDQAFETVATSIEL